MQWLRFPYLIIFIYSATARLTGLLPDLYRKHVDDWSSATALGVQHAAIPGRLSASQYQDLEGNMHLFIRCIRSAKDPEQLVLRGLVYWDRTYQAMLAEEQYLAVPAEWVSGHIPRMILQQAAPLTGDASEGGEAYSLKQNLSVTAPSDVLRPLLLKAVVPALLDAQWYLRLGDERSAWKRYISLQGAVGAALTDDAVYPSSTDAELRVYTVLGPPPLGASLASRVVAAHVDWHRHQGFAGTLLYMRTDQLPAFVQQEAVLERVDGGALSLIAFDYFPSVAARPMYTQAVIYNHALLSTMGRNTWLFLSEVDELLMTRVPGAIAEKATSCLVGGDEKVVQVLLMIYDIACPSCASADGEWPQWLKESSAGVSIIQQYGHRSREPVQQTKGIVNSDFVYQYALQHGHVAKGYKQHELTTAQCAAVARLTNLLQPRVNATESFDPDATWHWPLMATEQGTTGRQKGTREAHKKAAEEPDEAAQDQQQVAEPRGSATKSAKSKKSKKSSKNKGR